MSQLQYSQSITQNDHARLLVKHQKMAAFLAAIFIFMLLHSIKGVTAFPWDAADYWRLSSTEILFDFPKNSMRGYFYPTLLAPIRIFSEALGVLGHYPYRIISSLVYGYFFAIAVPEFYLQVFGGRASFLRRLITPLLVAILFPGIIIYTLSDLPSLAMMISASACALSSIRTSTKLKRYSLLILSGLLAYGAYNTRTIYLFPAGLLVLALALAIYHKHSAGTRSFTILFFLLGAGIASIPQVVINYKNHDSLSPMVITTSPYNRSLFAGQLLWGITLQRYETSIDSTSPPTKYYMDKAGERLFSDNKIGSEPFGLRTYFELALENPVDFAGIYGRHIVNGLDLRDGEVYTVGEPAKRNALAIFNFLIVFSGLFIITMTILTKQAKVEQKIKSVFWGFLVLLPAIMIIPGAIETRFFLAIHLAIYCSIAFTSDPDSIKNLLHRHWFLISLTLAISATLFFSISTTTLVSLQYSFSDLYQGRW
ncbi:hypothetical protein NL64_09110 [Pseudomonas fluorescens]|uniref:hypothetical protein n=1 Tax=Pseudomonas fluorescens TaxID=294 RepID=UPI00054BE72A|nr:hypothetical protein [Pseudomonas fluorescens]KII33656.1 hypothetical protein NL64_09110 [Pseudomonas fluorescens]